jgi:hypothetical protein
MRRAYLAFDLWNRDYDDPAERPLVWPSGCPLACPGIVGVGHEIH